MEPGVITFDGYVVNGNRRMAILEQLHKEEPTGKWQFLEAVRLPQHIEPKVLWKLEAGIQLSQDAQAEYHPVNELLKIKQGINAQLSPSEVARAMYGRTVADVEAALKRLELIDLFLESHNQAGNYGFIKHHGLHEHFIDIQKSIMPTWDRAGLSATERQRQLLQTFALIMAGVKMKGRVGRGRKRVPTVTHWDIRELGKVFQDYEARSEFETNTEDILKKPKEVAKVPPETLIEDFQRAKDVLKNKEDRDRPVVLIERATQALDSIDKKSKHLQGERVITAFHKLQREVDELANVLGVGVVSAVGSER